MSGPRPIIGGAPDLAHDHVVAILARRPTCGEPENVICSGTLIAPRAVLTAAHCLTGRESDELEVLVGDDASAPDAVLAVWGAAVHPDYEPGAPPEMSADLAVLHLEHDVGVAAAVAASTTPAELVVGAQVRLVGFGATTAGGELGTRVAGDAIVDAVGAVSFSTGATGVPCGGDSGGAAFVETAAGPLLVGVIKASGVGCADEGLVVRVDAAYDAFVAPAIATPPARPERPPFDPDVAYCAETCEVHDDCPLGMLCLPDGDAGHCGYRDARVVAMGEPCDGASSATCIPVGQGLARECRELLAECPAEASDAGGCCAAGGGDGASSTLVVMILAMLCTRLVVGSRDEYGRSLRDAGHDRRDHAGSP